MGIPDWITWGVPFLSGIAGVYTGLKVGIVRLEANYCNLRQRLDIANNKLEHQVGEDRCLRQRVDCQGRIEKFLDKLDKRTEILDNKISELMVYIAKHHGDGKHE